MLQMMSVIAELGCNLLADRIREGIKEIKKCRVVICRSMCQKKS
nr:recombinase family protein [Enterococcus faecalis]